MYIGTGSFSNCKECGRKVPIRLRNCPHCREPDPHLKNWLGWRIDYTKSLDPTVPKRSRWPFRIRFGTRFIIPSLIAISVVAVAVDYLFPDLIIELLGLEEGPAELWVGLLYLVIYFVLPLCVLFVLKKED